MYTEYRNEDQALTDAAEQQIEDLMSGIISPDEVSDFTTGDRDEKPTVIYNDTDVYNRSDGVYNMTYPVPGPLHGFRRGSRTTATAPITAALIFRAPRAAKVVAAQKGCCSRRGNVWITVMAIMCLSITAQTQTEIRSLRFMPIIQKYLSRPAIPFIKAGRLQNPAQPAIPPARTAILRSVWAAQESIRKTI